VSSQLVDTSGELVSADLARSLHEQDGRLLSAAQADLRDLLKAAGLVVLAGGESPTAALEPVARLSPLRAGDGLPPVHADASQHPGRIAVAAESTQQLCEADRIDVARGAWRRRVFGPEKAPGGVLDVLVVDKDNDTGWRHDLKS